MPRTRRIITLLAVTMAHAALIAAWMAQTETTRALNLRDRPGRDRPLELVSIPEPTLSRVRADTGRPAPLHPDVSQLLVTPMLTSASTSAPSSASGSHGKGVDWLAEAHRAVRAYEIRRDHPVLNELSGRSPANDWWPQQGPHAGDSFKTAGGDWIVWISDDCYQIARWHAADAAPDSAVPQIVCPNQSAGESRQ